MLSERSERG